MSARVIDGRGLAAELKEELAAEVARRSLETANTSGMFRDWYNACWICEGERIFR